MNFRCAICGNEHGNVRYVAREMMFGLRERFEYVKCSLCGCLQIVEIPTDMSTYYPPNYYSFSTPHTTTLLDKCIEYFYVSAIKHRVFGSNIVGFLSRLYREKYRTASTFFYEGLCNRESRILDVGCGNGLLLDRMGRIGFSNLTGVDPFIDKEIKNSRYRVLKKELTNIEGTFDLIMLHHSFEHMPNPKTVFSHLKKILSPQGRVLIRIPVVDCYAWRKYGMDWFQVDAPRHFYLHNTKTISMLSHEFGLKVEKVVYDSTVSQITVSERYARDLPAVSSDPVDWTKSELRRLDSEVKRLNMLCDGDQACFYIGHKTNG